MFVPLPVVLAMLLPILIGLPIMATPWRAGVRNGIAAATAILAMGAFAAACLAFGPGSPPFDVIQKIANL